MRSPILLPMRMNAAETSASSAMADWTPLAVVSRSRTTAEIDTFISDVSTTRTNIAIARRTASLVSPCDSSRTVAADSTVTAPELPSCDRRLGRLRPGRRDDRADDPEQRQEDPQDE